MSDEEENTISVKFDVWRKFYPPFKCLCCGEVINEKQFIFSCLCPYCDLGKCGSTVRGIDEGHGLKLWKNAEVDKKLQIIEELK